jgi:hypothetical protein
VYIAVGAVDGGTPEIITAPGPGGGPDIRVWKVANGTATMVHEFFAYAPIFVGGVTVAAGDVNGDGFSDIITGPGPGGGPDVRVFSGATLGSAGPTPTPLKEFFAYSPIFDGGVYVAAGDVNGDGFADIITGAGAGGGPNVTVFSGVDLTILQNYFPYSPIFDGGVRVSFISDTDGDGIGEIAVAPGPGGGPDVRIFDGGQLPQGTTPTQLDEFFAYSTTFAGGVFVGGQ